jgi:hypothetical protein
VASYLQVDVIQKSPAFAIVKDYVSADSAEGMFVEERQETARNCISAIEGRRLKGVFLSLYYVPMIKGWSRVSEYRSDRIQV